MKLQQALHGYADGHTLLASSHQLKPRDARTMLGLSDISGPGARIDETGCLTGYALPESGAYALARTWAAPEMPRPGCVWTHTLLIDFADLATLASLSSLLSLFRRPEAGAASTYAAAISLTETAAPSGLSQDSARWARLLLAALYGAPQSRIIATPPPGVETERTVIALWEQQWPRLRRGFRFSTLSGADRSNEAGAFDLQLLAAVDRAGKTRFPGAVEVGQISPAPWMDDALADLVHPNSTGLRLFFHRVGGDVASGREAFAPLCRLARLLTGGANTIDDAVAVLDNELGKTPLRAARTLVVNAALPNLEHLSDVGFHFALRHLDLADRSLIAQNETRMGLAIAARAPDAFVAMLAGDELSARIATAGLAALSPHELVQVSRTLPELLERALDLRPDLVADPAFWSAGFSLNAASLNADDDLTGRAIGAMMLAGRSDLAGAVVAHFGAKAVLACAVKTFVGADVDEKSEPWVVAASSDASAMAAFLAGSTGTSFRTLVRIARACPPDSLPNVDATDPWVAAFQRARGNVNEFDQLYLRAYLVSRSMGWRSSNSGELAQIGFDPVYEAANNNRLPQEAWQLLDQRLPWPMLWYDRDRCTRLRNGLVDLFVNRELSEHAFAAITNNDRLFLALTEIAARTNRGRRFLKRVLRALKHERHRNLSNRIPIIEALVD